MSVCHLSDKTGNVRESATGNLAARLADKFRHVLVAGLVIIALHEHQPLAVCLGGMVEFQFSRRFPVRVLHPVLVTQDGKIDVTLFNFNQIDVTFRNNYPLFDSFS